MMITPNPMRIVFLTTLFLLCGTASSQELHEPILVRRTPVSGLPISMSHFTSEPPDLTLVPRAAGARIGHLWIRTSHNALFIVGKVYGDQPDFPHSENQILSKDHVEVWLAASPDVQLPEIGWGNQFEDETLPKGEDSCSDWAKPTHEPDEAEKKCRAWALAQLRYRTYFKRLFVRQWLLAPDLEVESYAGPAYEEIEKRFFGLGDKFAEIMKPRGKAQLFLFPEQSGYSFEILIPFDAFPPLPTLRPSELYLLVDLFSAAPLNKPFGAYSTSSPARVYGKPETFNRLQLYVPLFFALTPCDLPLAGTDKRGGYHAAWFFPSSGPAPRYESEAFIIGNDPAGYRYEPEGLSPTVRTTRYFWRSAGPGEWVCGPHLTHKKGNESESFPDTVSEDGFDVKRLPEGDLLIKTGPRVWYSEFGSGQCGACPRSDLRIFDLRENLKLYQSLLLGDTMNPPSVFSQDFTVSADWSKVTEFNLTGNDENLPGSWSSTTWCLRKNTERYKADAYLYEKCGQKENVQPPDPPVLKELRDIEY